MPITHLTDFSDRLSPMLVKELRQGMRARSFTLLFLVFQILLGTILLTASAVSSSDSAGSFASGVIFTMFAIAALFIQPMRGITALSTEITGNTIEMMVLTRLNASRIVFGKWIAIVSQTGLILITIIPYLILRYFFGGMILLGELVFLALIFLSSMSLTAIMVGFSGTNAKLIRSIPILGVVVLINVIPSLLFRGGFNTFMTACTMSDWDSLLGVVAYICFIAYLGWCALSHGISSIAPAAENHSTLRRLIALGLVCITAAIGFFYKVDAHIPPIMFAIILLPATLTALTEPSFLLPPVYKPFLKRGLIGRIASVFLLPGWPTGVIYTTLLIVISVMGIAGTSTRTPAGVINDEYWTVSLALTGGILLPALLSAYFSKQETRRFTNFMIFLLASVVLTIIPTMFTDMYHHPSYLWLLIWNPPICMPMLSNGDIDKSHLLTTVMTVDLIILFLLLVTAIRAFRGYREIMLQAEQELAPPAAS